MARQNDVTNPPNDFNEQLDTSNTQQPKSTKEHEIRQADQINAETIPASVNMVHIFVLKLFTMYDYFEIIFNSIGI